MKRLIFAEGVRVRFAGKSTGDGIMRRLGEIAMNRPARKLRTNPAPRRADETVEIDRDGYPRAASAKVYAAVDRMRAGHYIKGTADDLLRAARLKK